MCPVMRCANFFEPKNYTCPTPREIQDYFKNIEKKPENENEITISVADLNDEVIMSHLDAIARRNAALLNSKEE